jgi:hypothetical protein
MGLTTNSNSRRIKDRQYRQPHSIAPSSSSKYLPTYLPRRRTLTATSFSPR